MLKFYSTHSELQMEFTNWHSCSRCNQTCTIYSVICEIIHSQRVAEPVSTNSRRGEYSEAAQYKWFPRWQTVQKSMKISGLLSTIHILFIHFTVYSNWPLVLCSQKYRRDSWCDHNVVIFQHLLIILLQEQSTTGLSKTSMHFKYNNVFRTVSFGAWF